MNGTSQPMVVLYGRKSRKDELTFLGRSGHISLQGDVNAFEAVLQLCNGLQTVEEICAQIKGMDTEQVLEFLSACEMQGIVQDSRELYLRFHEDSVNPELYSLDLGAEDVAKLQTSPRLRARAGKAFTLKSPDNAGILKTLEKRRSVRRFQEGKVAEKTLSGLLRSLYSVSTSRHWTVPSGGALYPLDIYIAVISPNQVLPQGTYRWEAETASISLISDRNPHLWISRSLNAVSLVENSAFVIAVAASLKRSASKYANRGYRYALLEAGHAAQNAYVFCAGKGLGLVEYGGFNDEILAHELGLVFPEEAVLTTLIIGTEDQTDIASTTNDQETVETARRLRHSLVGKSKPVKKIVFWDPDVMGYRMPRWITMAAYQPPYNERNRTMIERCKAYATGRTTSEAVIKCLAEAFERFAWERYRSDKTSTARGLGEEEFFVDPRAVVPYAPQQMKRLKHLEGVVPYDPRQPIDWVEGSFHISGARIWVPSELVFSPRRQGRGVRPPFYRASSNGIAAHFDQNKAVETALYELIERDAFSTLWYSKRPVSAVHHDQFPEDIRERIAFWESHGYKVTILDITLDGPPVALVLIWSRDKHPALVSGAGSRKTFLDAAIRAFDEAEFMAMTWHERRAKPKMRPEDVRSPDNHGQFYVDRRNLRHAEWLLEPPTVKDFPKDYNGDFSLFEPVVVNITPKEHSCGLTVIRVVSEKLMPINFGFGNEHYRHSRMRVVGLKWNTPYPAVPHFFA